MLKNVEIVLELLYYCSGVALALIAALGLRQLSLAEENIGVITGIARTTAKRDAFKLAAEQCAHYYRDIILLLNEYDAWINGWDIKIEAESIKVKPKTPRVKERFLKEIMSQNKDLPALNALEGMSVLFTSGVASEEVAFSSIGTTFCHSVRRLLPTLVLVAADGYFRHVLSLYMVWQKRIERQKLDQDRENTEARLRDLEEHGIRPIGM